ncbi:bifunctional ornithine acetyltransferase/N-acetylglutamate synthase [Heyndrickxia sporothermodurans]|uniref:bifunctional ornithine acetyltransferase/N-acetylglutamate synthase n=1 Tax=Heyndrickxia TaxID=2837504 RepID=UPI000D382DA0|nr:bifunctional ornithine acetyltransferase/N-acetylglutamate synthase [Heyndrickxia sporothermodurans]PTY76640.1 bifunctional ornithine acetyltransferase/N-acetylglutamate synthase [Heyndrickxia sporothermodurans]
MNSVNQVDTLKENKGSLIDGSITSPLGFLAGGLFCGIKRKRLDLAWLYSEVPATAAAVYTTNLFQAPPLKVTQDSIQSSGKIQGVIVNSGNANACTGEEGLKNALLMRQKFAEHLGVREHLIAVSSTGIIGEQLPIEKIENGILNMTDFYQQNDAASFEAAILTTDSFVKHACAELKIDGKTVTIGGAAKGSGMIHPNMATMLAFITTDANIQQDALNQSLKKVTDETFNMITVDGDTSTNDTVLILANGKAGNKELTPAHPEWHAFEQCLKLVCQSLAKQIARDGEGATKLIEVQVKGAETDQDAKKVAKAIVGSNLVKTAIYGEDPNWGRIIAAIGYSGIELDPTKMNVSLGPFKLLDNGLPFSFSEKDAAYYLQQNETIQIFVDLSAASGNAVAWGCDLTYDYVKINASYRT